MTDERAAQLAGNIEVVDVALQPSAGSYRAWVCVGGQVLAKGVVFFLGGKTLGTAPPGASCATKVKLAWCLCR